MNHSSFDIPDMDAFVDRDRHRLNLSRQANVAATRDLFDDDDILRDHRRLIKNVLQPLYDEHLVGKQLNNGGETILEIEVKYSIDDDLVTLDYGGLAKANQAISVRNKIVLGPWSQVAYVKHSITVSSILELGTYSTQEEFDDAFDMSFIANQFIADLDDEDVQLLKDLLFHPPRSIT